MCKRPPYLLLLAVIILLAGISAPVLAQEKEEEPAPEPAAAEKSTGDEEQKGGEAEAEPLPGLKDSGEVTSQTGDLKLEVKSNFFTEFPGFDLEPLTAEQRDKLLKQANKIYCTCGCRGDTVARCVVMDPTCQTAREMLQKLLDGIAPDLAKQEQPE